MNAPLRRVAIAAFVLFGLMFANLNYVQYVKGGEYRKNPTNKRVQLAEYDRQRGWIVVSGGTSIAESKETTDRLKYLRVYPAKGLYSHAAGYKSPLYGSAGIEQIENSVLSGDDDRLFVRRVSDMITRRQPRGGNVRLTLDKQVQAKAAEQLAGRKGAAVALDPTTGEILAMVSAPTYDPNPLASHDSDVQTKAWKSLNRDPDKPLLNRALRQTYPPGSTFKVIVSAAAVRDGIDADTLVPSPDRYTPPQTTRFIQNFDGGSCGGDQVSMKKALTVSCNTSFAQLGVKLGADKILETARDFGFEGEKLSVPLSTSPSRVGELPDPPTVAQSSIGQRDVRMTPLQGAMIAAAVANGGRLMKPYLVQEVQGSDLSALEKASPTELSRPLSEEQARQVQIMMRGVVESGTGRKAQIDGIEVGGKTGTAEDGDQRQDHSWFIGFAMRDGKAIGAAAVVLENAGTSSSSTAAMAGEILSAIVASRGNR